MNKLWTRLRAWLHERAVPEPPNGVPDAAWFVRAIRLNRPDLGRPLYFARALRSTRWPEFDMLLDVNQAATGVLIIFPDHLYWTTRRPNDIGWKPRTRIGPFLDRLFPKVDIITINPLGLDNFEIIVRRPGEKAPTAKTRTYRFASLDLLRYLPRWLAT